MKFSEKLLLARRRAGLSQRQLSKLSGVHSVTISKIETGTYKPAKATKVKLMDAIGGENGRHTKT